ncbi:MAG: UTP--glucose-1-phosphate uridylyltransferase GalU [Candidatus Omnitrophica bacterium]|nr:UTP--glucose-1-phosphate uridylyltransferase GalU [Candidatus Omnitrophota bacterium]
MIKKCLFPIAGYGTRFLPLTKSIPKEMIPILNKPLIHYAVQEALDSGIHQMVFVTGRGKRAIEDYFDYSYEVEKEIHGSSAESLLNEIHNIINNCTFSYTRQAQIRGLGHAILTGETLTGKEPFAVILSDDLCVAKGKEVISQMIELYNIYKCCIVAIETVPKEQISKYGCIEGTYIDNKLIRVSKIVEKPNPEEAPSNLGVIGRYILTPDIFHILKKLEPSVGNEIQLTDALDEKAARGELLAYQFDGRRFDCGNVEGYVKAIHHFSENERY